LPDAPSNISASSSVSSKMGSTYAGPVFWAV